MIFKLYPKYVYFRTQSTKCTETALLLKYYHQETTEDSMNTRHTEGSCVQHSSYGDAVSTPLKSDGHKPLSPLCTGLHVWSQGIYHLLSGAEYLKIFEHPQKRFSSDLSFAQGRYT